MKRTINHKEKARISSKKIVVKCIQEMDRRKSIERRIINLERNRKEAKKKVEISKKALKKKKANV